MMIRGVLFDMDGTIVDVPYNWPRIKADLGTQGVPILSYLNGLAEPEKSGKWKILQRYEEEATRRAVIKRGMRGFLDFLAERRIKTALITNNSRKNTDILLGRFRLAFDFVMTRDDGLWKPSAAPLVAAMNELHLRKGECSAVGDSHFDIKAAEEAGIPHIFILSRDRAKFTAFKTAEIIPSVRALREKIEPLLKN